jgi:secreted Zn-dependent insulinase-like peptidase
MRNRLDNVHWRFEEKGDPDDLASWAVQNMHEPYPRSRILSQAHRTNKFDADLISKTLACLNPNNMALAYCSPDEAEGIEYDRAEEYFGAKYAIVEISDVFLHNCRHAPITSALHTPLANPYIPIGVHKVAPEDVQKPWTKDSSPIVLKDEPGLRIWYQQGTPLLHFGA